MHAHWFGSLSDNSLCGLTTRSDWMGRESVEGTYTVEGINALCEAIKSTTTLTRLKCASQIESILTVNSP